MTFIQRPDGAGLVRDDFPLRIARNTSEPEEWPNITPSSRIPIEFDSLFDWLSVQEVPNGADPSRKYEVVHVPRPLPARNQGGNLRRFTMRIFGVVGNCNLSPLGNWDRTVSGCTRAIQFITICPGAFMQQFEAQRDSLRDIRRMVYKYLNESMPQNQHRDTEMFFHRRLFGVINKYGPRPSIPDSCTTDEERLEAISCRWRPIPSATYARKLDDDSLRRCSAMVISPGDFVDVTATVDIVSVGRNVRDKRTHVHFAFTRVVRLLPDKDLIDVCGSQAPSAPQPPSQLIYEDRLPFEDDVRSTEDVETEM